MGFAELYDGHVRREIRVGGEWRVGRSGEGRLSVAYLRSAIAFLLPAFDYLRSAIAFLLPAFDYLLSAFAFLLPGYLYNAVGVIL